VADIKSIHSTSEELSKTRTYGKVRCHNAECYHRIEVPPGAKQVKCPGCGAEWRIYWIEPTVPRIRGPVWDSFRKMREQK
jgi:hypothetical protein